MIKILKVNELYKSTYIKAKNLASDNYQHELSNKFDVHIKNGLLENPQLNDTFFIGDKEYIFLNIIGFFDQGRSRIFNINVINVNGSNTLIIYVTVLLSNNGMAIENLHVSIENSYKFSNKKSYLNFLILLKKLYFIGNPNNSLSAIKKINNIDSKKSHVSEISVEDFETMEGSVLTKNFWYFIVKKTPFNNMEEFEKIYLKNRKPWDSVVDNTKNTKNNYPTNGYWSDDNINIT